jgi:hypothetical protein
MPKANSERRYRVYFEERSEIELIVHAASADEAKAHCEELFRKADVQLSEQFKVRTNASDWMVEDLSE